MFFIFSKFRKRISKRLRVIKRGTISMVKFSKGHNSIKNVDRVTVIVLYTLSNNVLYLCQVS